MSNLQTDYHFKLDFPKVDQHTYWFAYYFLFYFKYVGINVVGLILYFPSVYNDLTNVIMGENVSNFIINLNLSLFIYYMYWHNKIKSFLMILQNSRSDGYYFFNR